jgi:hypothetical protein
MGFTHYWTFKKAPRGQASQIEAAYQKAMQDCQRVIKRYYSEHGGLSGYSAHTTLGQYGGLNVNGKGDDGHETFAVREHFSQNLENDGGFNFCKTARKPYDLVVIACLTILKHRLGECIEVSSDGDAQDWQDGVAYARKIARLAVKNPIGERVKESA